MFDRGDGPPIVIVPGTQGRWEWMRPALDALAASCRTISYSLSGDFGSGVTFDAALGFENFVRQLDAVLDRARLERAAVCGVSFGGFIAVRYAALRATRVSALILASAPAPGWSPTDEQSRYIASPWRSAPLFALSAPARLLPEIRAAAGSWPAAMALAARHTLRIVAAPAMPPLMAQRITAARQLDYGADAAAVRAPTLVVTGEPALDRVVPVENTRRFLSLIDGAQYAMIERTGHIGLITRPGRFAQIVSGFVQREHDRRLVPGGV